MIELRFHGRGGQGAVTAAALLVSAAIEDGKYAQAVPSFGPERRGAPVESYVRISDEPILARYDVLEPDYVIVLDPTLMNVVDYRKGLKEGGMPVLNLPARPNQRGVAWVNATELANEILGKPITNTAMLGSLLKVKRLVNSRSLRKVIKDNFPGKLGEKNCNLIKKAYKETEIL